MPALDAAHTYDLTIGGASFYGHLLAGTLRVVEAEGSQIDTLTFELEDLGFAAEPVEWQECQFTVDGTAFFGGYVTKLTPTVSPALTRRKFTVNCESYMTLFSRTPRIRQAWVNQTPRQIVADLFTAAGVTGYDLTTYVATTPAPTQFVANDILLNEALDKLAAQCGGLADADWTWRTDAAKKLHLGPASSDTAPFAIADITLANWTTSFPPLAHPTADTDASQIRNRITVKGGVSTSGNITDNFTGDGATVRFNLSHQPIRRIVSITVAGSLYRYGWDWVDDFGATVQVLVDFEAGTIRFPDAGPPAVGAAIVVTYLYDVPITTVRSDTASHTKYGIWFDYEYEDASITSETEAQAVGDALLQAYANGVVTGQFEVERFGLHGGQIITITYPLLGLSGSYVLRQVTTELKKGGIIKATGQFGGIYLRLSRVLGREARSSYYSPSVPYQNNNFENAAVSGSVTIGTGLITL